ncbi:MAG: DNA repair protein RadC [Clostridiales bacterium]|nr:DNA repair protein RadC [Clostridiales bacterium]
MGVHHGHRERMKQEFLQGGLAHFSEPRVLELLLFYSRLQGDVNPLAHRLLDTFGSLAGVLDAPPEALAKVPGVGENTVVLLKLLPAIAARYLASRANAEMILSDSASLHELFLPYFFGARNEMSYLACFDSKLKLLGVKKISEGSPNANEISIRKISTEALALNATVVVLAHNHPSGLATPSEEDIFTTRYIQDSLRPLGITLYDHVILADGEMVSLKDSRYLMSL